MVDFSIFAPVLGVEGRVSLLLHFAQLDLLPGLWCCEDAGVEDPSYSKCSSNDGTYLELQREQTQQWGKLSHSLHWRRDPAAGGFAGSTVKTGWQHRGWNYMRTIHKNPSLQWNKWVLNSSEPEPITNPSSHSMNTAPSWAKLHLTQLSRSSGLLTSSYTVSCYKHHSLVVFSLFTRQ